MPTLATKRTCTGCMACVDKCPHNAIEYRQGNDGHRYIHVVKTKCVECKLCEKTCPVVNNSEYGCNDIKKSLFRAAWSDNEMLRSNGATSGIFGTIASWFIEKGGWIAGAIMDDLNCKYILTNNKEDIKLLQGSKYTSSNPAGIYESILQKLREGERVLFCGLPCHVAALLSYVPHSKKDNLYTIDLICGGVSSPLLIEKFVKQHPDIKSIIKFRDKADGWKSTGYRYMLTCKRKDGSVYRQQSTERNLVTDGFACELTDRYSCYNCKFAYIHRQSDITIGDLWKDTEFKEQHFGGVSSLIMHSRKGEELVAESAITHPIVPYEKVLLPNFRIYNGYSIKQYFPERVFFPKLFKILPYRWLQRIYCSDLKTLNILWWPVALYRVVSFRFSQLFNQGSSKKIIIKANL